jgi:hypothetical protein
MKLKVWAVAAGILVDSMGSLAIGILYLIVVLGTKYLNGEASQDTLSPMHLAIADGLGLTMSALGGFVAARLAEIDEVHHGAAAGFGSLVVWLLIDLSLQTGGPRSWHDILLSLAVVPLAAVGGYIALRVNAGTRPRLP